MTTVVRARRLRAALALAALLIAAGAGAMTAGALGDYHPRAAAGDRPHPGPVDIGFSQDMMVHHQQAVTMAQMVADRGTPEIRSLATGIELAQAGEIGTLQGWLALWDAPPVGAGAPMRWMASGTPAPMPGMGSMPASVHPAGALMPGMASQAELDRLSRSTGRSRDVLFLQLMIRHHQGGVAMASYAAAHASLPQVRDLAARMVLDQGQEINLMVQLLRIDHAAPLPPPAGS